MWPQGNRGLQFKIFSSWANIVLSIFWKPPILAQGHPLYPTPNQPLLHPRRCGVQPCVFTQSRVFYRRDLTLSVTLSATTDVLHFSITLFPIRHLFPKAQNLHKHKERLLFFTSVFCVFNLFILASGDQRTFEFVSASLEISPGASSQLVLFVLHCNLIATGGNRCLNTFHYERPGCEIQGFRSAGNLSGTWISMRVLTERFVP